MVILKLLKNCYSKVYLIFSYLGVCHGMAGRGGPYFLSKPNTYRKQVGGTVTLSCHVDNLGKFFHIKNNAHGIIEINNTFTDQESMYPFWR